ncbi:MAG: hypothetical protein U0361_01790 [Nitrospiraceae bacterium]
MISTFGWRNQLDPQHDQLLVEEYPPASDPLAILFASDFSMR